MAILGHDVRAAVRSLRRNPVFSLGVAAVFSVGIALAVAILTLVQGILLEPLPFPEPDRLVRIYNQVSFNDRFFFTDSFLPAQFDELTDFSTMEALGRFDFHRETVLSPAGPDRIEVLYVEPVVAELIGLEVAQGRFPADDPEAAVLSWDFWRSYFAAEADVVGRTLQVGERVAVIAGVLAPTFRFVGSRQPKLVRLFPPGSEWRAPILGQLAEGVSASAARDEWGAYFRARDGELAEGGSLGQPVVPLLDNEVARARTPLLTLFAAALFVLIIACANGANLMLVRSLQRGRELATRAALGAGSGGLMRMLAAEGLCLSLAGGVVGFAAAGALVQALVAWAPGSVPRVEAVAIRPVVVAGAVALTLATGILTSLVPMLSLSTLAQWGRLYSGGTGYSRRTLRLRAALVVGEVALALVLLAGCALMIRTFLSLRGVELGFDPSRLLTWEVALPEASYPTAARQWSFLSALQQRLASHPGIEGMAVTSAVPMGLSRSGMWIKFPEGREPPGFTGEQTIPGFGSSPDSYTVNRLSVTPDYFSLLDIPLLTGRLFDGTERGGTSTPVIISRQMADELWPGQNPVGERIGERGQLEVIGIVADLRFEDLRTRFMPTLYQAFDRETAGFRGEFTLLTRTRRSPESMIPAIRGVVADLDSELPLIGLRSVRELVDRHLAQPRYFAFLFSLFGLAALAMAGAGIYAVVAFSVSHRIPEIGVRMALGATAATVTRLIFGQGVALIAAGGLLGLTLALALGRFLESLLFEVPANDPPTLAVTVAVLAAIGLLACLLPALRAGRTDPIQALRHE